MKVEQKPVIGTSRFKTKSFGGDERGGEGMTKTGKGKRQVRA
jgi:hypothetical protein